MGNFSITLHPSILIILVVLLSFVSIIISNLIYNKYQNSDENRKEIFKFLIESPDLEKKSVKFKFILVILLFFIISLEIILLFHEFGHGITYLMLGGEWNSVTFYPLELGGFTDGTTGYELIEGIEYYDSVAIAKLSGSFTSSIMGVVFLLFFFVE